IAAGLNALSGAEKVILKKLEDSGRGKVFYDADPFYINDKNHHAGLFIRRNLNEGIGEILPPPISISEKKLEITIHTAGHEIDQAGVVAGLLANLNPDELKNTAIVLTDEKFLIPLLTRLPERLSAPNITMGIGLLDSLFINFIDLLEGLRASNTEAIEKKEREIENHPLMRKFNAMDADAYIGLKSHFFEFVQASNPGDENYFNHLKNIFRELTRFIQSAESNSFEVLQSRILLTEMSRCINRLDKMENTAELNQKVLNGLLKRSIAGKQLNLLSEPTENLQILGLLETRALGFDRIILCSANEDIIPGSQRSDSFFPFEIKTHHKLPGRREKECVFAYHFYRLLHDSKKVDIIHYNESEGMRSGEKSRYIHQIEYQLSRINPNIGLHLKTHQKKLPAAHVKEQVLEKTPEVIENIKAHLRRGISPSSLNRYLEDSLEWYYGNVLKLEEPERDPLDSAGFGTIVHEVLETLYKNRLNKTITLKEMDAIEGELEGALREAFEKIEGINSDLKGVLAINYELAKKMVTNYLGAEKKRIKEGDLVEVKGCEVALEIEENLSINGAEMDIHFKGKIDRVELRNGELHLVDFKTGSVDVREVKTTQIDREKLAGKRYYNQLMLYKWLAKTKYSEYGDTQGQIITLTAPHKRDLTSQYTGKGDEWEIFEEVMREIIEEMLHTEFPLRRNPDFKYPMFEKN
ncbi:MAG: PD-(D/E)XK nuclease family protein, partial [Cryomorphaceae bacterium]